MNDFGYVKIIIILLSLFGATATLSYTTENFTKITSIPVINSSEVILKEINSSIPNSAIDIIVKEPTTPTNNLSSSTTTNPSNSNTGINSNEENDTSNEEKNDKVQKQPQNPLQLQQHQIII